ncbi:MAG: hypothetical protein KatS3mg081_1228 [Gemmatimonadales bacterium]|nr:MAG: hypothetical protein KatS3mg081_1228 [Gemmatimonadales bacterium]
MLVGTLGTLAVKTSTPDSPIVLRPAGSVDALVLELAVNACDVAVLAGEAYGPAGETAVAAVCSLRAVAALWVEEKSGAWCAAASGRYGPVLGTRVSGPAGSQLESARLLWLGAWAKWISDAVQALNGDGLLPTSTTAYPGTTLNDWQTNRRVKDHNHIDITWRRDGIFAMARRMVERLGMLRNEFFGDGGGGGTGGGGGDGCVGWFLSSRPGLKNGAVSKINSISGVTVEGRVRKR